MRVDLHERIAGQPAVKVREFLRRAFDGNWNLSYVAKKLRVDLVVAEEVVAELVRRGYIKTAESSSGCIIGPTPCRAMLFPTPAEPSRY